MANDERATNGETYGLPPVLTVDEVASFLRLNAKTVYSAISAGEFPARKVGKRTVVLRDALITWLSSTERVLSRRRRRT